MSSVIDFTFAGKHKLDVLGERSFEDAVGLFSPYTEIKDPNPEAREAMRVLIQRARDRQHVAFLFVNNRLEGNAPATILSLVEPGP